jgi:hypothetical protein
VGFETQITLNRKDYGINWNKTLDNGGMLLSDDVLVTINIEAGKPKAGRRRRRRFQVSRSRLY